MSGTVDGDCVDAKWQFWRKPEKPSGPRGESHVDAKPPSDAHRYNMNYPSIGQCIIINNKNFDRKGIKTRTGTDVDADNLMKVFSQLGYKVRISNDLSVKDIKTLLSSVSKEDHSKSASLVCVLLSYGYEGVLYGTDDAMDLKDLTSLFRGDRCPTLVGKPKLFFIQACPVKDEDDDIEADSVAEEGSTQRIPVEADFLYAYSTAPGYYSWKNTGNGSWFIQSVCDMLQKFGRELELIKIMTRVNHKVALEFESCSNLDTETPIPCIVSMLTKEVHFPNVTKD
ncbi:caspase-3-like [Sardina pilchardus]|uniref:caspase-3-like n=1 Tax=Sardina pilchardus TaxID=27697 RepID=UPI002E13726D